MVEDNVVGGDMFSTCPPCRDGDHQYHQPSLGGICVGCACPEVTAPEPAPDAAEALAEALLAASEDTDSTHVYPGWIEGYASTIAERILDSPALDAVKAGARAEVERERDRAFGNQRWMEGHLLGVKDGRAEVVARVEAVLNPDHSIHPRTGKCVLITEVEHALARTTDTNPGGAT